MVELVQPRPQTPSDEKAADKPVYDGENPTPDMIRNLMVTNIHERFVKIKEEKEAAERRKRN